MEAIEKSSAVDLTFSWRMKSVRTPPAENWEESKQVRVNLAGGSFGGVPARIEGAFQAACSANHGCRHCFRKFSGPGSLSLESVMLSEGVEEMYLLVVANYFFSSFQVG